MEYLSYLKNPFVAGITAGLILVIALFIDSKYNYKDTPQDTYLKAFVITALITGLLVYYGKGDVIVSRKHRSGGSSSMEVMDGLPEF